MMPNVVADVGWSSLPQSDTCSRASSVVTFSEVSLSVAAPESSAVRSIVSTPSSAVSSCSASAMRPFVFSSILSTHSAMTVTLRSIVYHRSTRFCGLTIHRVHTRTSRLDLDVPDAADLDAMYEICGDPQSWTHFPSLRHTDIDTTERTMQGWATQWSRDGLGPWIIRVRDRDVISGYGGCSLRQSAFWNLGYRLHPDAQGRGYATEMCQAAIESARQLRPELPVVAYLLEHNLASAKVAERVGLTLLTRGPDIGNPDPEAIRLLYADRPLSAIQVDSVLSA